MSSSAWGWVSNKVCKECGAILPVSQAEFEKQPWWRKMLFFISL